MAAPEAFSRAASLVVDIGEPEFPFRRFVEVSTTDRRLSRTEQRSVEERMSVETLTDAAAEELAGTSPPPIGGPARWYRSGAARGALADLCRYTVPPGGAGLLLGLLASSQVCVPLLDAPVADWPTLVTALDEASAVALVPTSPRHGAPAAWSLVASGPRTPFLVRTREAREPGSSLGEELSGQIRRALGL
jgi:hypothetical protein